MKSHRNILIISFLTSLLSLFFVVLLPQASKLFQIALALMGSSIIAFLIEIPVFISIKKDNYNKLYYSLYDLKANSSILKSNIDNLLNNDIVIDHFYDSIIQNLTNSIINLRCFDSNYYFSQKRNNIIFGAINSICNAFNNIKLATSKYSANYSGKRLEIVIDEGKERNITPNEMTNELKCILLNSEVLIKTINTHASYIFSKNQYKIWLIDDSNITNTNNNCEITKK